MAHEQQLSKEEVERLDFRIRDHLRGGRPGCPYFTRFSGNLADPTEDGYYLLTIADYTGKSRHSHPSQRVYWHPDTDDLRFEIMSGASARPAPAPDPPRRATDDELTEILSLAEIALGEKLGAGAVLTGQRSSIDEYHASRGSDGMGRAGVISVAWSPPSRWEVLYDFKLGTRVVRALK